MRALAVAAIVTLLAVCVTPAAANSCYGQEIGTQVCCGQNSDGTQIYTCPSGTTCQNSDRQCLQDGSSSVSGSGFSSMSLGSFSGSVDVDAHSSVVFSVVGAVVGVGLFGIVIALSWWFCCRRRVAYVPTNRTVAPGPVQGVIITSTPALYSDYQPMYAATVYAQPTQCGYPATSTVVLV
jgi:hypothetical protein